jgi:hypothetical protein
VIANRPRSGVVALLLATATALLTGCGNSGSGPQTGNAFVFLTVDGFSLSATTANAAFGSSLDDEANPTTACVTLRNTQKNPTVTATTALDNVVIDSYTVSYPIDGLGPFVFNTTAFVPVGTVANNQASGNTARFPIILVPPEAKRRPPLRPFPPLPNQTTATVIFRGRDGRGQRVSTEGSTTVIFVRFGTDTLATC